MAPLPRRRKSGAVKASFARFKARRAGAPIDGQRGRPRRGIYLLPNAFTTAALFGGFYAIVMAMNQRFDHACWAVFIAMVLDSLDGRVARLTNTQSEFGAQYDSLSDMVSFGAAPALVIYEWSLRGLGKLGWIAAFVYCAGAALRLARFNTNIEVVDKRFFQGLPSPAAAALVVGFVMMMTDPDINISPRQADQDEVLFFVAVDDVAATLKRAEELGGTVIQTEQKVPGTSFGVFADAQGHKVGVAALKFADLQNFRGTSYVFDLDRFTSFEGKTGPYLLYQSVRIKSVLRKAAEAGATAGRIVIHEQAERDLAMLLDAFEGALQEAYDKKAPNFVAEHAYKLAQTFSKFYAACPIMSADTEELRASRLSLAETTLRQLELTLDLLGIEAPERM